ncbi:FAD/NAD(P)-binding domain-containing protein [Polyporus arcularius HHB13444]|uniref:FAD/NAD(P)-binding domain-containing protein n=1 Tax=Polyporus arcularius HHB13444 TaxID=1314778 RepID=A0A5C3PNE3_9APHY|nr:FAD/NAD(P)-binding domain-containing protein [Polyporus arcularius HHB13444]
MPFVFRDAELTLDFLVVGGGIAGLAVAYALSTAGHRVRVVEKFGLDRPSAGQRIPPNLSKILWQWIGPEELMKVSTRCVGSPFHQLTTGENIGYLHWKPAVMAEMGGDFLLMHHDDLIRILHKLAIKAGARVDFNTEVVAVQQGSEEKPDPSVTLANGEVIYADVLIGADGSKSLVRDVVLEEEDEAKPGPMTTYSGVVKAEDMVGDPELAPLVQSEELPQWPVWMGNFRFIFGHPVRARKEYAFTIFNCKVPTPEQAGKETWDELFPTEQALTEEDGTLCQKLVKLAGPRLIRSQLMSRRDIDDWVDSTGRIVLIGDSAHPNYPGGTHTAAMAVEDGAVLGSLFSHLSSKEQIPAFLNAYQELRQRRCEMVNRAVFDNARMMCLPPGPEADARDQDMAAQATDWDDGMLKVQFEEISAIFLYDAGDDAEEWWINWGRFHDSGNNSKPSVATFDFGNVSVRYE